MFFAPLVPALAVVVVGYLVGYGLTVLVSRALDAVFDTPLGPGVPEVVGWLLGLLLLVVVARLLMDRGRRLRRALRRAHADGLAGDVARLEATLAAHGAKRARRPRAGVEDGHQKQPSFFRSSIAASLTLSSPRVAPRSVSRVTAISAMTSCTVERSRARPR